MSELAVNVDSSKIEIGEGFMVDARRKGERRPDYAVFAFCDQVGFPFESLDLPGTEEEGGYRDDSCGFFEED